MTNRSVIGVDRRNPYLRPGKSLSHRNCVGCRQILLLRADGEPDDISHVAIVDGSKCHRGCRFWHVEEDAAAERRTSRCFNATKDLNSGQWDVVDGFVVEPVAGSARTHEHDSSNPDRDAELAVCVEEGTDVPAGTKA